ncbi:MAG: hypothetical protein AABY22_04430 [Nanoarchaeota archaeon]
MLGNIISGVVGGVVFGFSGYLKNQKKNESFDYMKLGITVIVAGIVGAVAGYTGMEYGAVADATFAGGIGLVAENIVKAVYRKLA